MTLSLMEAMGFEVDVYIVSPEGEQPISLDIRGEDAGLLIGRQGRTLTDIQTIIALLVSKRLEQYTSVTLDIEDYKSRRFEQIRQIARNAAVQVDKDGDSVTLENMNSAERRIVHMELAEDPTVETQSDGRGSDRRVTIYPS
jgi:spoIIIJ-associated protein